MFCFASIVVSLALNLLDVLFFVVNDVEILVKKCTIEIFNKSDRHLSHQFFDRRLDEGRLIAGHDHRCDLLRAVDRRLHLVGSGLRQTHLR